MLQSVIRKNSLLIIECLFVFGLFYYITSRSPIVGDAYNYAVMGLKTNPFTLACLAFFSWSGRFFSELWGFFMCSKIDIWNILNPLFFTAIFICLNYLGNSKNSLVKSFLILLMMLTVETHIRTQTYTWIMGTTYIIPLMLSLVYFSIIKFAVIENAGSYSRNKFIYAGNILLFYIGLTMENIAATMLLATILILGYYYLTYKKINKALLFNVLSITLSFLLLRVSPGANGRLAEYHPEWVAMSFLEQLIFNIKYFIQLTFTKNTVILTIFSLLLINLLVIKRNQKKNKTLFTLSFLTQLSAIIFLLVPNLTHGIFVNGMSSIEWLYTCYWIIYIILSFYIIINYVSLNKEIIIFLIVIAGASSACLMISPIYSSRSLLYFVYFIILVNLLLIDNLKWSLRINRVVAMLAFISVCLATAYYYQIYSTVAKIQSERISIIQYYLENPQEEAWIPRIPDDYLHSANIEDDNEYHLSTFKEYYGLPDQMTIHFYNAD